MILVDTQPSTAEPLHLQALQAARFVLSPVNRDEEESIERYVPAVARIRDQWNPELEHLGTVSYGFTRGQISDGNFDELEARSGITAYRTPVHNAPTAVTYCRLAHKLVHEYALAVEETLRQTGSSYGVGQAGLNVTVAGKTVNKSQRARLPPDAPVIGDVLLGGGLAGDYFALGRAVRADILQARGVEFDVDPPEVIDLREHNEEVVAV